MSYHFTQLLKEKNIEIVYLKKVIIDAIYWYLLHFVNNLMIINLLFKSQ